MEKRCSKCDELKNLSEFSNYKKASDGKQCYCKECNKKYQKIRHDINNNNWKLYRLTIDIRDVVKHGRKSYYIGITKKELKDRLNEHLSDMKNGCHVNFWINEMFKYFPYEQIENIDLRKYIKIELLEEYASNLTLSEMKKIEKKAVYEQSKYSCEVDKWTTDILNLEHHQGNVRWKKDIENRRNSDIIKQEELKMDRKKPSKDLEVVEGI